MELSWLDGQESWLIVSLLLVAMLLGGELAYRLGRRLNARMTKDGKDTTSKTHFNIVLSSLLGLLALLLSFTFGMAAQRYESRRLLMIDDVTSIGTLYVRCGYLPAAQQHQIMPLLKQYVDLRPMAVPLLGDLKGFDDEETQSRALLLQMMAVTKNFQDAVPPIKGSDDVANAFMDVAANHTRRLSALSNRVPDSVIWMLLGAAIVGLSAIGYSGGLVHHRDVPAQIMLSVLVCGTIFVILDLDRPSRGFLQVDQAPMIRLQQIIDQDPMTQTEIS
jgi:hypothetical protein